MAGEHVAIGHLLVGEGVVHIHLHLPFHNTGLAGAAHGSLASEWYIQPGIQRYIQHRVTVRRDLQKMLAAVHDHFHLGHTTERTAITMGMVGGLLRICGHRRVEELDVYAFLVHALFLQRLAHVHHHLFGATDEEFLVQWVVHEPLH